MPGAPPLDPPMYVPKYHQKLGCQANGGARAGRAPLDPPMELAETGLIQFSTCDKE